MRQKVEAFASQPWLHEIRPGATADLLKETIIDFSSDRNVIFGSKIISAEKMAPLEETGSPKLAGIGGAPPPTGLFGKEQQPRQQSLSLFLPSTTTNALVQASEQELLDHSMAYGSYQFSEPHYGRVMPAYSSQALPHLHGLGVHSSRPVLPLEVAEEPVYVNAKQYHGILRRRQSRAKAELEKKLIKVRRPYLHESRHLHAMRRARGCGGRFLNTKKLDNGSSAIHASTNQESPASSVKTGSTQTGVGSLSSESVPFNLSLSKPQSTSHGPTGFQLSSHHGFSSNRAAEARDPQERVIRRGLPHTVWAIK